MTTKLSTFPEEKQDLSEYSNNSHTQCYSHALSLDSVRFRGPLLKLLSFLEIKKRRTKKRKRRMIVVPRWRIELLRKLKGLSEIYHNTMRPVGRKKEKKKDKRTTVEESYYLSGLMGSLA